MSDLHETVSHADESSLNENVSTNYPPDALKAEAETSTTAKPAGPYTQEELRQILSQRHFVDLTDEDMDPIEWMVRKLVPIPNVYYWDILEDQHEQSEVWVGIRVWHSTISGLCTMGGWIDRRVAQPLARGLGLTESRFDYVTDQMSAEDWQASRREVDRRKQGREVTENTEEEEITSTGDVATGPEKRLSLQSRKSGVISTC
jgi:hypothetical protein